MWLILIREFIYDIRKQKLRTFLTILAITWGTIAVVLLLAFGEGLGNKMLEGMLNAGNQMMMVWPGQTSVTYEGLGIGRRIRFREEDIDLLHRSIPQIEKISPQYGRWGMRLRTEYASTSTYGEGVNPDFDVMRSMFPVAGGRFINQRDINQNRRVVFLGNDIAKRLYPEDDPIGKRVFIDDVPFTIVGVMAEKFQTAMNNGPDANRAIIPHTTFRTMYGSPWVHSILIRPNDPMEQEYIKEEMRRILGIKYKFDPADERALGIWDFVEAERINRQVAMGVEIFLFTVGFFTLLIAGVGVANIMYVVVKERTREIGIKKAIGARKWHIVSQFVFESVFISFIGGTIGLSFSAAVVLGIQSLGLSDGAWQFFGNPILSSTTMAVTVGILALIGFVAGVFPARKAAIVDPVESLRYE
jgi:putative ABC transport system permease protein